MPAIRDERSVSPIGSRAAWISGAIAFALLGAAAGMGRHGGEITSLAVAAGVLAVVMIAAGIRQRQQAIWIIGAMVLGFAVVLRVDPEPWTDVSRVAPALPWLLLLVRFHSAGMPPR